jgi:hypothetical protein
MRGLLLRIWNSPTLMTWGSLAARLLGMTLVLPLVLVKFQPAEVAIWQLFVSIYTMQLLFDFGLSPTFSRLLSYARGGASLADIGANQTASAGTKRLVPEGERTHVLTAVLSTQRWLYWRISLGVTVLFAAGGTWALMVPVAGVADAQSAWLAWGIVLMSALIGFWGNGYSAALQAWMPSL